MNKKKVLLISLGVFLGIIAIFLLLSFTAFSLKNVEIDFRTSHQTITVSKDEIIESAGIKKGGSVFFKNKQTYIKNLEEEYPYIKVVNIETVFPSKFVIHIAERQEIYAVKQDETYFICDNEFKVLKITDSYSSTQSNAILVEGVILKRANYALSDKLDINNFVDIYESFYTNNRTLAEQQSTFKSVKFSLERDDVTQKDILNASIIFFNGQEYVIKNCTYGLSSKTHLLIEVYSQIFDFIGREIKSGSGENIVLTEENLKKAQIIINNYYDYTSHNENECYFDIIISD